MFLISHVPNVEFDTASTGLRRWREKIFVDHVEHLKPSDGFAATQLTQSLHICSRSLLFRIESHKPWVWWDYVTDFADTLKDKKHATECADKVGKRDRGDVTFLSMFAINNRRCGGKLGKSAVLKAIWSGFEETTKPSVCLSTDNSRGDGCNENSDSESSLSREWIWRHSHFHTAGPRAFKKKKINFGLLQKRPNHVTFLMPDDLKNDSVIV
ncbi:vacuolar-sorting receptor 1-like protein [Carex littledalei]|uniref:Vacuolar-sorting receptor 1-like protein n=1 Tax=Carex littledalei TaxID=544730 RepID=A0A833VWG5_9POAL|nr:vacuolar-sorting receptor 1-like protein [Carex littledalei]